MVADTDEAPRRGIAGAITSYQHLLIALVEGRLAPAAFAAEYFDIYLHDESEFSDDVFAVVDGFFFHVDAYVDDPALRADVHGGIGPEELKRHAVDLLAQAGFVAEPAQPR